MKHTDWSNLTNAQWQLATYKVVSWIFEEKVLRFLHRPGSELKLALKYLLWTADATGKQEAKTSLPAFSSTSGLTTATQIERVADFWVLVLICQTGSLCELPKKTFWQPESRLAGYSTIKINWGDKIMSLTVIHAAVRQLLNGLLLKWPLAFPLNRCSDDAAKLK